VFLLPILVSNMPCWYCAVCLYDCIIEILTIPLPPLQQGYEPYYGYRFFRWSSGKLNKLNRGEFSLISYRQRVPRHILDISSSLTLKKLQIFRGPTSNSRSGTIARARDHTTYKRCSLKARQLSAIQSYSQCVLSFTYPSSRRPRC
jgi:hypothetical protein